MSSALTEATEQPNTAAIVRHERIHLFIELLFKLRAGKSISRPSGRLAELIFSTP
jgi:hypothetical protein